VNETDDPGSAEPASSISRVTQHAEPAMPLAGTLSRTTTHLPA
jgi:hypothetical protein